MALSVCVCACGWPCACAGRAVRADVSRPAAPVHTHTRERARGRSVAAAFELPLFFFSRSHVLFRAGRPRDARGDRAEALRRPVGTRDLAGESARLACALEPSTGDHPLIPPKPKEAVTVRHGASVSAPSPRAGRRLTLARPRQARALGSRLADHGQGAHHGDGRCRHNRPAQRVQRRPPRRNSIQRPAQRRSISPRPARRTAGPARRAAGSARRPLERFLQCPCGPALTPVRECGWRPPHGRGGQGAWSAPGLGRPAHGHTP